MQVLAVSYRPPIYSIYYSISDCFFDRLDAVQHIEVFLKQLNLFRIQTLSVFPQRNSSGSLGE